MSTRNPSAMPAPDEPGSPACTPVDADDAFDHQVAAMLASIGENPQRDGLRETPRRFREAWREWTRGYRVDPRQLLKILSEEATDREALVLVQDVPVYSTCEHHLAPFFGVAHIGYFPNARIVGLSKIPRVVDALARRLQIQERLTKEIADVIEDVLRPHSTGVVLQCRHLCIESRGIRNQASTTTTVFRGEHRRSMEERMAFLSRHR